MILDVAAANIKSNPRMSAAAEAADMDLVLSTANQQVLDFVTFCEIAYPRMRRELRRAARRYGYKLVGCNLGSENVVAYRPDAWHLKHHVRRWLSAGVAKLTPTRTATWCVFEHVLGNRVNVAATHLVSGWENPRSTRLDLRKRLARAEVRRLGRKVRRAVENGHLVVVGGDMNSQHPVSWGSRWESHVQGVGTMGKMMQIFHVDRSGTLEYEGHGQIPLTQLHTDHPVLIVKADVTPK